MDEEASSLPTDPEALEHERDIEEEEEQGGAGDSEYEKISEDFDAKAYGIYQQLPVIKGEPDFESGSPQTAEEYLRRVRHEAAQLPDVVVSDLDARTFDGHRTQYVPADAAEPPLEVDELGGEWMQQFLEDFAALRLVVHRNPPPSVKLSVEDTPEAWKAHCFGMQDASSEPAGCGNEPSLPVLQQLDQRMVSRLLRWHMEALQEGAPLDDTRAQWLYALAAVLEKPLQMGPAGTLRQLLRWCATQPRPDGDAAAAARLHMLIAIAGAYFRQDERLSQIATAACA